MLAWLLVLAALILLGIVVKSADVFVRAAAKLARRAGISELVIGLTLVAIGTSLPELVNAIVSAVRGVNELALGNLVGSNMVNLGVSAGLTFLLTPVRLNPKVYQRESMVLGVTTLAVLIAVADGFLSRAEGAALLVLFIIYAANVARIFVDITLIADRREIAFLADLIVNRLRHPPSIVVNRATLKASALVVVSGAALLVSSSLLVDVAVAASSAFHISTSAIGVILALGTAAPEMTVTVVAARRGYYRLLFGNLIGSCIVNLLLILGLSVLIHPIAVGQSMLAFSLPLMVLASGFLLAALAQRQTIPRWVGVPFIVCYAVFLALAVMA